MHSLNMLSSPNILVYVLYVQAAQFHYTCSCTLCTGCTVPNIIATLIQRFLQVNVGTGYMVPGRAGFTAYGARIQTNMFFTLSTR